MDENKPLTTKELRELLGHMYNDLPSDDEELIKEARDTHLRFKRIHKDCIPKQKVKDEIEHITDRIICIPNYSEGETHVQYAYKYVGLIKKSLKKRLKLE